MESCRSADSESGANQDNSWNGPGGRTLAWQSWPMTSIKWPLPPSTSSHQVYHLGEASKHSKQVDTTPGKMNVIPVQHHGPSEDLRGNKRFSLARALWTVVSVKETWRGYLPTFPIHYGGMASHLNVCCPVVTCMCVYQKQGLELRYRSWSKSFVLNYCQNSKSSEICNVRILETCHLQKNLTRWFIVVFITTKYKYSCLLLHKGCWLENSYKFWWRFYVIHTHIYLTWHYKKYFIV